VTDNDLSDLANEFAEFGKSFSVDNISFEKEERDPYFVKPKPKREFSDKFKVEINPQKKYTYNNLYNLNTEIYSSSPKKSTRNIENEDKPDDKFENDLDKLDSSYYVES